MGKHPLELRDIEIDIRDAMDQPDFGLVGRIVAEDEHSIRDNIRLYVEVARYGFLFRGI